MKSETKTNRKSKKESKEKNIWGENSDQENFKRANKNNCIYEAKAKVNTEMQTQQGKQLQGQAGVTESSRPARMRVGLVRVSKHNQRGLERWLSS